MKYNIIQVIKHDNNIYTVKFKQQGFDIKNFKDIQLTNYAIRIFGSIDNDMDSNGLITSTIIIKCSAIGNPRPETLFQII